ncbi:MAG: hypothetical protein FJX63_10700 [Alphaproteobacteria bacterium]|nr:hypothetical protein [Alphaproteobacteria bacterium]
MTILAEIERAQDGALLARLARATDLSSADARLALSAFCPAIARQLEARVASDAQAYDNLASHLDDGTGGDLLADSDALLSAETAEDGNAILADLYGSRDAAIRAMREMGPRLPEMALLRLAAMAAALVLDAMVRNHARLSLTGAMPAASGGGLLGTIVSSIVRGAVQGAMRQLAPRRRHRRRYTDYFARRRRPTRRRRRRGPSLEDVFAEILGVRHR